MPPSSLLKYAVSYKKKDGSLSISDDKLALTWSPSGGSPTVTIATADITNLQQTPASSPRVALKVFVGEEGHVFSFTNKEEPRQDADAVTAALRTVLTAKSTGVATQLAPSRTSTPAQNGGSNTPQPAAMAIAKAVSSRTDEDKQYDDAELKNNIELQRTLLASDKALNERFQQALRNKPESVSGIQFTAQFWSTRIHLLRAHAIERAQKQGEYNVLPDIKYTITPGLDGKADTKHINITKDQIRLIFKQYPVVRKAYDENCPPWTPPQFWEHFFASRLLKKLKGFVITREDAVDPKLDKYLDHRDAGPLSISQIPRFMDLAGNSQNHSQRQGNRPDVEMRESTYDQPILHTLNRLSEKLLSHVAPEDSEAHAPIGMDEQTFEELRLRDLAMEDVDNRITLNLREQQHYSGPGDDDLSADAKRYAQQDPKQVLTLLNSALQPVNLGSDESGTLRLDRAIGYHSDDDDSDTEMANGQTNGNTSKKKRLRIGSHAAITNTSTSIVSSISRRRKAASSDPHSLHGLSQSTFDTLTITHNTTTEFLHYFWSLFHSGDASKSSELAQLVTTLDRSLERIDAVGVQADKERNEKIEKMKTQVREYYERTGKRRKIDENAVTGGKKIVDAMVKPTVEALAVAVKAYRKAYDEQTKEAAATATGLSG
ncbi:putative rna polymerase ii transcription factor b subunit 1 [Acrodontium crateriforme]|uniref:Rna polymerase ii transcription factor b subunit 1 n=1 Tax=Acrodontium crateriforme TaxID=150365 RepID=A0AAQ3RBI7_9PEZI|nr:putative rna polymerase ii transcription factor b subunit 1 [Acrodontium crateriforme]